VAGGGRSGVEISQQLEEGEQMTDEESLDRYFAAAEHGDISTIERCLADGVDIDVTNRRRRTAILVAAINRHYDVVEKLISAGADIDKQDETNFNPFTFGCVQNDVELVRMMIRAGTDVDRLTRFGGVGLHPAAEKGYVELVRELLETTDINVNLTNWVGWTPLLEAVILNDGGPRQQEIVKLLLDHGANPQMTDKYGRTPRELAEELGYTEIAELLSAAERR
jgi:ankyrin repeat protein